MARSGSARRYAKALFQLAKESNDVSSVRGELADLSRLFEQNDELRGVLQQPLHPTAQRRAVLNAVAEKLGASPLIKHFYSFLIDQRRLVEFGAIVEAYDELAATESGVSKALVTSAVPLSDTQRERLSSALASRTGQRLELEIRVDPALLGGVVAQVGDLVFDGSLRTQLRQLRSHLTRG